MIIKCTAGESDIQPGITEFSESNGGRWRVARQEGIDYSPSNLGGTPSFACEHIGGPMDHWDCVEMDGTVIWCGDSIAAMVITELKLTG